MSLEWGTLLLPNPPPPEPLFKFKSQTHVTGLTNQKKENDLHDSIWQNGVLKHFIKD